MPRDGRRFFPITVLFEVKIFLQCPFYRLEILIILMIVAKKSICSKVNRNIGGNYEKSIDCIGKRDDFKCRL